MSKLNYKTILSYKLREYDDQPRWNVHIKDNTGHPVTITDAGEITVIQRTDYNIIEVIILYYKKREGAFGEGHTYFLNNESYPHIFSIEDIWFENCETRELYNVIEYEEYTRTHTIKEGGISDVRYV